MSARRGMIGAALLGVTVAGCEGLLDVSLPGATPADALNDPTYAQLLVTSVQADFECAFSNYVFISGHMAGELIGAQSALATIPYQRRDVRPVDQTYGEGDCGGNSGLYTPLSIARFVADDVYNRLDGWTDEEVANRSRLMGRTALYSGFSHTVFAEGWCQGAFDLGPPQTPAQMFTTAEAKFTTAIGHALPVNDTSTLYAAYVGRARVRLALGKTAEALADAKLVRIGHRLNVTRAASPNRNQNDIFQSNNSARAHSIDAHFWDVRWGTAVDPRTRVIKQTGKGSDGLTDMYLQQKYLTAATPIRLSSYVEARLIIAEIEGGQSAVGIINELHTAAGIGTPVFASTDEVAIRAQVREERRREFFLEGRRMGDLNRFGGWEEAAGGRHPFVNDVFALTKCFPLPDVELRNNPNF